MRTKSLSLALLLFAAVYSTALVTGTAVQAGEKTYAAGPMVIDRAWAAETPRVAKTGAVYFTMANGGIKADYLIFVTSPRAQSVVLHAHRMVGNVMQMAAVFGIAIPPNQTVALKPGGRHVMLIGLTKPLKDGDKIPLTLSFKNSGSVQIIAVVGLPHGARPKP
jgi:copper(I)-binding protein